MEQIDPAWYSDAFDEDYLERYAHRDEDEADLGAQLAIRVTGLRPPARVFDLCCGAGRHLVRFCAAGFDAAGGDLSLALLSHLRHQEEQVCEPLQLVRLDMRRIPVQSGLFDLVTNYFTAFGYFPSDEENFSVFAEVARILRPGGWFLLDFLNAETTKQTLTREEKRVSMQRIGGEDWRVWRCLSPDGLRAVKIQRRVENGQTLREIIESVRLFTPDEIESALRKVGLVPLKRFGDYHGNPFQPGASARFLILSQLSA